MSLRPAKLAPQERPVDTTPGALVLGGLRRGALQVFLPVALAGQAVAWLAYLISGAYGPWSWTKIGVAYALTSARVPFDVAAGGRLASQGADELQLQIALGAFTIAFIVLAFRAGRDQARGLERRPSEAAAAGLMVAPGVALPMAVAASLVSLGFPRLGIEALQPVPWTTFVFPLLLAGVAGAAGGLTVAREVLEEGGGPRPRVVGAVRGGATACAWALVLATLATLLLAAVELGVTKAYGRFIGQRDQAGAILVVHHAVVLPNQSALVLGATMGVPAELWIGEDRAATIGLEGFVAEGAFRGLFGPPQDPEAGSFPAPAWYWAFLVAPAVATVMGGRIAGEGARSPLVAIGSGALAGLVYAALVFAAGWFASIVVPILLPRVVVGPVRLGQPLGTLGVVALAWGVVGCAAGAVWTWWGSRRSTEPV